ncbi:MAG: 6-carboxytetrahydropterin synthase [Flavobacteriales bacterium]|nr:6-carboxytetrahydropterin synthase [Flavobacteriales bacterium]
MVHIIRRERFNAAHKLWNPDWSEEENLEVFGGCANPNWHGHNYELFVSIKGPIDPKTGFVVNLKHISSILKTKVIDKLDHKNLNLDVDFLKGKMTSTEVLAVSIWEEIVDDINSLGVQLHSIKVQETENNSVEYFGE